MCGKNTIQQMIETMSLITSGDLSKRVKATRSGTLNQLGLQINNLAERYQMAQETIRALNQQLRKSNLDAIMALTEALAAKDPYTRGHSERVSLYSMLLSEKLGLTSEEIDGVYIASYLHDVGKIGIHEDILNKPGRLTEEEFEQVKAHAHISSQIVSQIPNLSHIAYVVRHHHERHDGGGYPDGLSGDEIPLGSRILAIVDAFDCMTSDRPYRKAHRPEEALLEIKRCAGRQFNPELSDAFIEAYGKSYGHRTLHMSAS